MLTDTLTDGLDIRKMVDVSVRFMLPDNDIGHCWRLINDDCEARILNPIFAKHWREIRERGPHPGFHFRKVLDFMDTLSSDSRNTAFYYSPSPPLSPSRTLCKL